MTSTSGAIVHVTPPSRPAAASLTLRGVRKAFGAKTVLNNVDLHVHAGQFLTIVGRSGEIIVQIRGDETGPHTVENSFRKAYTARTFRSPSGALVERLKADPTLGLIHLTNVIANQGALPIKVGDDVIGGVGVSGAPGGPNDEGCAAAGIAKVADQLK